jgi:hypothetical protein
MRFNKSLAVAGALGLAVLTASPALAEPAPEPTGAPGSTASTAPVETPSPEAPKTPAPKPETPKTPAPKPEAPKTEAPAKPATSPKPTPSEKEVEQKGTISLSATTAKPGDVVTVTVTSTREAITAITSRGFSPSSWNVPGERKEYRFQVRVSEVLGEHAVDAHFADRSNARAILTVVAAEDEAVKPAFGFDTQEVAPGGRVKVQVSGDMRAGEVIVSSDLLGHPRTLPLQESAAKGTGTAFLTVDVASDAKPGRYPIRADFGRFGTVSSSIEVVAGKPPVKPVPVTGLDLKLEPNRVIAGQSYFAGVTTTNVKAGTPVTITDPGGKKYTAKVDGWGTARVKLTSPKGSKPGAYTVKAALPSGQSRSATLTVLKRHPQTSLALILDPAKVYAGGKFDAIVATEKGEKTTATITDPSGKKFTVKVGTSGVAVKRFHVASSTKAGDYWFQARLADGTKAWAKLTVKPRYKASDYTLTPRGGAATGGGHSEGAGFGGVALGGLLLAGGAGSALFARRRAGEAS